MLFAVLATLTIMLASVNVRAQATSVFGTGLKAPTKIILSQNGNLLSADAGEGPNTGRVSIRNGDFHNGSFEWEFSET